MNLNRVGAIAVRVGAVVAAVVGPAGPARAQTPARDEAPFAIDPVTDGTLVVGSLGFYVLETWIISTGEIVPQRPGSPDRLLAIDRGTVGRTPVSGWGDYSTVGLWGATVFAAVDPLLSWQRSGRNAALVDAVLYAEALTLTKTFTNITKISMRRPRPSAYRAEAQTGPQAGTDQALSFPSGHTSTVAAVSATATYLAFTRAPGSLRAWTTLGMGILLTASVGYGRVRAGVHFPTDVIAGGLMGAGIGVLVPALHRRSPVPGLWIGVAPGGEDGTGASVGGRF
jgi:membrane-associated phospholipid phosphatase